MRTEPQLRVRVVGEEIVVTLPGYHYAVTYSRPSQGTGLIARNSPLTDDPRITMKKSELLAKAWKLANRAEGGQTCLHVSRSLRTSPSFWMDHPSPSARSRTALSSTADFCQSPLTLIPSTTVDGSSV